MSAEIGRRFRVVAGIDLSPSHREIAARGAREARLRGVPLVLVHALRVPPRAVGAARAPAPSPELLTSTARWLESVAEPLRTRSDHLGGAPGTGLEIHTRVIAGRADDVLIAESLTAVLTVVGEDRCGVVAAELGHRGCSPLLVVGPALAPSFSLSWH